MADYGGNKKIKEKPLVSVCMPCYNSAGTVAEAVRSALVQNAPLEVIVVDDCSTDNTWQVLSQFDDDPRVICLKNERNLGACQSRNRAVAEASAPFVAFLDADDIWAEGKLEKQLKVLKKRGCVLCCTGRELMTPEGVLTGRVIGVKPTITYRSLLRHNSINCSSVVLKTRVAREFPMEHEDSHEDYITWLRVLKKYGEAAGIDEPLLKYRLSSSGKSGSKLKSAVMTYRVYRYMGFGRGLAALCFISYALHGLWKYTTA